MGLKDYFRELWLKSKEQSGEEEQEINYPKKKNDDENDFSGVDNEDR